jgi:hypothetical protein
MIERVKVRQGGASDIWKELIYRYLNALRRARLGKKLGPLDGNLADRM